MLLVWILLSTFLVAVISLIGIFTLVIKSNLLSKILFNLIGFSAGSLIGGAFLHILPESLEKTNSIVVFHYVIAGIVLFFLLERYFYWRHCHEGNCDIHAFTYLNLVGDGLHNFIDGMIIAASFITSFKIGIVTTLAVILHEIPQELGDFGVLIYGGLSRHKALLFNFISALTAVLGALIAYFISSVSAAFSEAILPLTAGGFIYIATSDLIPELHKEKDLKRSTGAFIAFLLGILLMIATRAWLHE
ncbi:MAG: ZIP family metal transporter [Candidatus Omnitrophica bacterium]|nr:ZIP family metal transporter [Candidatus Omnitrophota bacterium]